MSLIEQALRKSSLLKAGNKRTEVADSPDQRRSQPSASAPAPIDPAKVRRYLKASVDREIMRERYILPELEDRAATRAFKILRTKVLQKLTANDWHTVAVTGTTPNEGKTLTAINLARALAQDVNTYVFLVDLDLQRPQVGAALGMTFDKGITDYLQGDAEIEQVIYEIGVDRLAVIPNARSVEHSSEFLSSPRMLTLLSTLSSELPRRIIIFDMPPVLVSDDVLGFVPHVDCVLLVVAEGITERSVLESAKETLSEMNVLGVVLNRSREGNDSQYYY
jgi:protein-tyrosine kinase